MNRSDARFHPFRIRSRPGGRLPLILLILMILNGCALKHGDRGPALNYFEYNRGKSFATRADLQLDWNGNSLLFHQVRFEDDSFFPDNFIIPNAFLRPLVQLRFADALKAFTEPYYGYRFVRFLRRNPHIGLGIEFTHHKIFLNQADQQVIVSGFFQGRPVNALLPVNRFVEYLSISHGVNHVNLVFTYRWLLAPTAGVPEGRWQPYVSVGAGPAFPHLELKLPGDGPNWTEYAFKSGPGNFNFSAGTGVRYQFSPHFGAYLEYKFSYSHLYDLDFFDGAGNLEMAFPTHHLMWGISLIF